MENNEQKQDKNWYSSIEEFLSDPNFSDNNTSKLNMQNVLNNKQENKLSFWKIFISLIVFFSIVFLAFISIALVGWFFSAIALLKPLFYISPLIIIFIKNIFWLTLIETIFLAFIWLTILFLYTKSLVFPHF